MISIVVFSKCNCDLITKTSFFTKAMLGIRVNARMVFSYIISPRANSIRRTLLAESLIMQNKSNTTTYYISRVTKSALNGIALNSLMMFRPFYKRSYVCTSSSQNKLTSITRNMASFCSSMISTVSRNRFMEYRFCSNIRNGCSYRININSIPIIIDKSITFCHT
jgi:subtilase family serine protease